MDDRNLITADDSFGGSAFAPMTKSISESQWTGVQGLQTIGNISVEAARSAEKSLTPKQCYENSIPARAAIDKIAKSISKASPRVFGKDGREAIGGQLVDLLREPERRVSYKRWMTRLVTWYNISGEIPIFIGEGEKFLEILDPYRLYINQPGIPNTIDDVVQWRYSPFSGILRYIRADRLIYDRMFNPNPSIRGLSPFVTGNTEVGAAHEAAKYRKQFFENGAIPSHVIDLGEGVSRSQREDWERRYLSQYGNYGNNAHKVMVTSGTKGGIKIEQLEQPFQNSPFLDLSKWSASQIGLLFGVPPAILQFDSTTKFDNANEQRLMFVEDTLVPQMELLQEILQLQLVDPQFSYSPVVYDNRAKKNQSKLTKAMDAKFEQARGDSNLVLLIDADTMPIMATVKADQVAKAKEFREVLMLSPKETADYFRFDIPDRPEREEIYVLNNYVCLSNDKLNERLSPQLQAKDAGGKEPTVAQAAKEKRKAAKKAFELFTRKLRKLTLDAADNGERFSLSDADALDDDKEFRDPIRVIHAQIKCLMDSDDRARAIKDYFNRLELDEVITHD